MTSGVFLTILAAVVASEPRQAQQGHEQSVNSGSQRASFFGTQAEGDSFVYVLDVSGSMGGEGAGSRLTRATSELLRSIEQLTEEQSFYVVLFANRARPMFDENRLQMVQATEENKGKLRKWIAGVASFGGTRPHDALRLALELRPSAVFFLSDGTFNKSKANDRARKRIMSRIERGVTERYGLLEPHEIVVVFNRDRIPIHTVAFEEVASAKDMHQISEVTGGRFRFVTVPKREPSVLEEQEAQDKLARADRLHSDGQLAQARMMHINVVRRFPGTEAARKVIRTRPELFGTEVARELSRL